MIADRAVSDRALGLAVERGLITREQADGLFAIERESAASEPVDDEQLRFITGFADIFVSIGIVLFIGALAFIMDAGAGSTPMFAGVACSVWLLAEFFTGKRRMALPSIVLLVIFVGAVFILSLQIFSSLLPAPSELSDRLWVLPTNNPGALAVAAIMTVALAAMHYVRFHVPITIAAGALTICLLALGLAMIAVPGLGERGLDITLFACGLVTFAMAMRFDMSDPERLTRRTDIAFWLHLVAAPLIVHPLIEGFLHGLDHRLTLGPALGILWIFLILGVVAVIVDRRAILVSGLIYAAVAFGTVIKTLGFSNSSLLLPTVLLALGAFILLVSAGWQPLRRVLLRRLPQRLATRLPHPMVTSAT